MPPPAARAARARALWADANVDTWRAELVAASSRCPPAVVEIDAWFWGRCDAGPRLRDITSADLSEIVRWKMKRNKFRPRLQALADENTAKAVEDAATRADDALGEAPTPSLDAVRAALDALSVLRGIGPATATTLVTLCCASVPFFSEEAAAAVLGGYDHKNPDALRLTSALRAKAAELGDGWTARGVERALWSAAWKGEGAPGSKKRKAR